MNKKFSRLRRHSFIVRILSGSEFQSSKSEIPCFTPTLVIGEDIGTGIGQRLKRRYGTNVWSYIVGMCVFISWGVCHEVL